LTKFKFKNKSEDEGILFKNNEKIDIIEKCPKNKFLKIRSLFFIFPK